LILVSRGGPRTRTAGLQRLQTDMQRKRPGQEQ
jgi:hypothetical protein